MTLEDQRLAPPAAQCIEPGCDRAAAEGDERCELHQSRLGSRPSRPSSPPRQAPLPVVVEDALDASVAVPPARQSNRRFWVGLGVWALGAVAFFSFPAIAAEWGLGSDLATFVAFALSWLACGGLATYGAGKSFFATLSRGKSVVALMLASVTGIPTVFFLYAMGRELLSRLTTP